MELIKIVFGNLGGRDIERIFRNYFLMALLFKQLVFSLYSGPADILFNQSFPAENEQTSANLITAESSKENLKSVQVFQLLYTLSLIEAETPKEPRDSLQKT